MAQVKKNRTFAATPQQVWDVLADYPNIASWNTGVKNSHATSEATSGIGAQRHCDLAPLGSLEETVQAWNEPSHLAISIDSAAKLPIKSGLADFALTPVANGTVLEFTYDYTPKFGPVGKLLTPLLNKQFEKGFTGFLDDLETATAASV